MSKILLLGGSYSQLPAIEEAKKRGLYTIICDYLPDNPGRELADKYHNVSTTDADGVLNLAKELNVDFIYAYMSDPAALTTAVVSEKLGMPTNSSDSVRLLSQKDEFREFMKNKGFNTPDFISVHKEEIPSLILKDMNLPVVVKPVDSSDTKGVHKINEYDELVPAAYDAVSYSRADKVIIEEYVDCDVANFHGDAFIIDGKLKFCMLGDSLFSSVSSPLKPSSEIYPSRKPAEMVRAVENEVEKLINISGFKNGPVNIEARVNSKNEIYIMEIGPRSGGGFTPQTIYHATGFDMLKASFDYLVDQRINVEVREPNPAISFTLHANENGILKNIQFDKNVAKFIAEKHLFVTPGDEIKSFRHGNSNLGVIVLKFQNFEQVDQLESDLYDMMIDAVHIEQNSRVRS